MNPTEYLRRRRLLLEELQFSMMEVTRMESINSTDSLLDNFNMSDVEVIPTAQLMSCLEYLTEVARVIDLLNRPTDDEPWRRLINGCVVPAICLFGIFGNLLNLIVMTRKQLRRSLKHMERSVNFGLVALAFSDLLFCVFYLACEIPGNNVHTMHPTLWLYLVTYKEPVINVFLLASTWLTTLMALSRFFAICHPLHARGFIKPKGTLTCIAFVAFMSVAVNIPRFMHYHVVTYDCENLGLPIELRKDESANGTSSLMSSSCDCYYHYKDGTDLFGKENRSFRFAYNVFYTLLAIVAPFAVMLICNIRLVVALHRSHRMQLLHRANRRSEEASSGHRITPTLISLTVLFIILVLPSEILALVADAIGQYLSNEGYSKFQTATIVANWLLLVDFAANFVLYSAINAHFRRTAFDILCYCCRRWRRNRMPAPSSFLMSVKTNVNTVIGHVSDGETDI